MRSPLIAFGTVAQQIQTDLQISTQTIGLIGTIPMLAFATSSFLAPKISQKIGLETTLLLATLLLMLGIFERVWLPSFSWLLAGTIVLSFAISLGNVLVPAAVKKYTPAKIGFVLGLYSLMSSLFAGISAGTTSPVSAIVGWRVALGGWGILAFLALLAWLWVKWQIRQNLLTLEVASSAMPTKPITVSAGSPSSYNPTKPIWQLPMLWWISGYMGLQSLLYFVLASFLPSLLMDKGLTQSQAGQISMIFQFVAFPSIILLSRWVSKGLNLRWLGMAAAMANLIGAFGFGFLSVNFAWLWAVCTGFGCGVIFTLSLMIFTLKSKDSDQAAQLSGMAQSVSYGIAILGPFGMGWLKDFSGDWVMPWGVLSCLMLVGCVCGWFATADKEIV